MKILLIKLRYLGDVLLASSILLPLRGKYPTASIVMLVNPGTNEVIKHNPHVDEVLQLPRFHWLKQIQFHREIRARHFDFVLDLTDSDRSAFLSKWSGSPIRIGFNHEYRWRGKCYTHCLEGGYGTMHMVDYHAKALEPLGIHESGKSPELFLSEEDEQAASHMVNGLGLTNSRWVMIHPAARYWFKAWPPERFAALGDALMGRGYQVVLVGSSHEVKVEENILRQSKHQFISLIGKTKLLELGALMKRCSLFIGNDGGPMHMAAAVGCPVVALFGPTDPALWGPRGQKSTVIYKGLNCEECFHPGCFRGEESCMRLITVDEVVRAAAAFLT